MSVVLAGLICTIIFYWLPHWRYGRGIFILQGTIFCCLSFLVRCIFHLNKTKFSRPTAVVMVGDKDRCAELIASLKIPHSPVVVSDIVPVTSNERPDLISILEKQVNPGNGAPVKPVLVLLGVTSQSDELTKQILEVKASGFVVLSVEALIEDTYKKIPINEISPEWLITNIHNFSPGKMVLIKTKRLMDLLASILFLTVLAPIMAVAALAVKATSSGPAFYRQRRIGLNGEEFTLFKFRTMVFEAVPDDDVWTRKDDQRITWVGKILRRLRLDELPQLWNVIRGQMSLVGPRPEQPRITSKLNSEIPYYPLRHVVRPGITGWAQINYPYGASVEDAVNKLEYDFYYIKNYSPLLDCLILIRTIGVVLMGQGSR